MVEKPAEDEESEDNKEGSTDEEGVLLKKEKGKIRALSLSTLLT